MGRLFREFSVTIGVAVLVSCVISLTLTPMLGSRFLRERHRIRHGRVYQATEAMYQTLVQLYDRSLRFVLHHRLSALILSLAMLGATVYLFQVVPKGFIPSEDSDMILVPTETAQNISYPSLLEHGMKLAAILQKDPNVARFLMDVSDDAFMFVVLKPLRGADTERRTGHRMNCGPNSIRFPASGRCRSTGRRSMSAAAEAAASTRSLFRDWTSTSCMQRRKILERAMAKQPDLLDVSSDLQLENPELNVAIDRERALLLGISPLDVEDTLYSAYGDRIVSTISVPPTSTT